MTALPPAGWFPDPEAGGQRWRWWDGTQWAPPGYGYAAAYDPAGHARASVTSAETSHNTGRWFRGLMVAQAACAFVAMIGFAIFFHRGLDLFNEGPDADVHFTSTWIGVQALYLPFTLVNWGYMALYIAWIFNAGKFADLQQWPARRSRALGAFSVLIPVVNFWWPYEAICDCFPPGGRPAVALRWFVLQLAVPPVAFIAVVITALTGPTWAIALVVLLGGVLLTLPVVLGWQLTGDLDAMQHAHVPAAA